MNGDRIAELYDDFSEYAALAADPEQYPVPAVLPAMLERNHLTQTGKTVLDLGCGPGTLKPYTSFERYIGVDLSPQMLTQAAAVGYDELIQASLLDYLSALPDKSVDVAVCLSVAYFLSPSELTELLGHLDRVAREGWVVTLDGIPEDLRNYFEEEAEIELYDHQGIFLPDITERLTAPGWLSPLGGRVPMELVLKRLHF